MHVLMGVIAWVIGLPVVIVIITRGWTPPGPRAPRKPREPRPRATLDDLAAQWQERVAANAEATRAAAAQDQASMVACRECGLNHFGACPARVIDGRTGEVVGYWRDLED